eukprot:1562548-Rhodomonas_salina.2
MPTNRCTAANSNAARHVLSTAAQAAHPSVFDFALGRCMLTCVARAVIRKDFRMTVGVEGVIGRHAHTVCPPSSLLFRLLLTLTLSTPGSFLSSLSPLSSSPSLVHPRIPSTEVFLLTLVGCGAERDGLGARTL